MRKSRWSKKTEKIEVRLSPETKQAFHETCEARNESASSVIRRLIEDYVARFHLPVFVKPLEVVRRSPVWVRWASGAGVSLAFASLLMLPSSAQSKWEREFSDIDDNKDGKINTAEFLPGEPPVEMDVDDRIVERLNRVMNTEFNKMDADGNGDVTAAEFEAHSVGEDTAVFNALDVDGDGEVWLHEFVSPQDSLARASVLGLKTATGFPFSKIMPEANGDLAFQWAQGHIDEPPYPTSVYLGIAFRGLDADGSNTITLDEMLK